MKNLLLLFLLTVSPVIPALAGGLQTASDAAVHEAVAAVPRTTLPPLVIPEEAAVEDTPSFLQKCKDSIELNFVAEKRWTYLLTGFLNTINITLPAYSA